MLNMAWSATPFLVDDPRALRKSRDYDFKESDKVVRRMGKKLKVCNLPHGLQTHHCSYGNYSTFCCTVCYI